MLKADVNKEFTKLEIVGDLKDICTDLTHILSAINERLSEKDAEIGHMFRVMFTKGFMDGICFDDDREHMEHYLAEGDKNVKKNKEKREELSEALDDFLDFLKEKLDGLEKFNKAFEEKEKDDEAE